MSTSVAIAFGIAVVLVAVLGGVHARWFEVPEGHVGLVYRRGKWVRTVGPGSRRGWGRGITVETIDMRRREIIVAGQDILAADNVAVKVSAQCYFAVVEPEGAAHRVEDYERSLHSSVQLALRQVMGTTPVETITSERGSLSETMTVRVGKEAEVFGVRVEAVELKDITFPAETRRAFGEAMRARQAGLAALERARAQTAALRSLANAAKMIENNPALARLRLYELLQTFGAGERNSLVVKLDEAVAPTGA
ncbi:MAG: slipin family protein [Deltaproteobacteria bacterium]|nr:slipin family protein [Deltaproteobacteria bacterium]